MSSFYNSNLKINIFGESHGPYIGASIDGIAPGIKIDYDSINNDLLLRHSIRDISTSRIEKDEYEFISGIYNGYTTGDIITVIVPNKNTKSSDYVKGEIRPSHADYSSYIKSEGFNDYRGGGSTSGRLTVVLVILGSILKSILKNKGINIYSYIKQIEDIIDETAYDFDKLSLINKDVFPVLDEEKKREMISIIKDAKENNDSVGGIVKIVAKGVCAGIGEPFFDSVESTISRLVFSVPSVKGIEFGLGFAFKDKRASVVNDELFINDSKVDFKSNNNGGINGGITNSKPIEFSCVIKPCASISRAQESINVIENKNIELNIKGRHDSCIVDRARLPLESCAAIAICDLYIARYGYMWMK